MSNELGGGVLAAEGPWRPSDVKMSLRSLLVLSKGSADVNKILFDGKLLEAQPFKIARLYPGAWIKQQLCGVRVKHGEQTF